jgi:signal transduction histidine kinase
MLVADAATDSRFRDNPLVLGEPRIRFYAGVPLGIREGVNLGTLCVIDRVPRELSESQTKALEALARQVSRNLAARQFLYLVETFIGHAPLFVALKNSAGRYEFVNKAWRDRVGTAADPIGKTAVEWVGDEAAVEADRTESQLLANHASDVSVVEAFGTEDQKWIVSRFPVSTLSGSAGLGIIGIDSTERLRAEERLHDAERQLEHARRVESIGMVATTVAHEFNNVLMGIGPFGVVVDRLSGENAKLKSAAESIRESVGRGRGLVEQILRFGRPSEAAFVRVNLAEWLEAIRPTLASMAGSSIRIELRVTDRLLVVAADPDQMHQALANLVSNAKDAMNGAGDIHLQLTRASGSGAGIARLRVTDHGAGIPPAMLADIFQPLFTTKRTGTGIGLAVAQRVIEKHNGSIIVESEVGRGTTFEIRLPLVSLDLDNGGGVAF